MKKILYIMSAAALLLTLASCGKDDELTESIFDTTTPVVDPNQSTYEFDQWLYDNFGKPYNVEFQYKFNLPASDYSFQLAPAEYKRSQLLAHFIKYLFYDVYTKYAGDNFMKQYGPRIFHFIGSSGYSPRTGTEVLGLASGGVKITLYNINEMKPYTEDLTYDAKDIETINERVFHTMHHEFSHIMHQTKTYSCIITDNDYRWMMRIISASAPGFRSGDKEQVLELINKLGIDKNKPNTHWNDFSLYSEAEYSQETGNYEPGERIVLDVHRSSEKVVNKDYTAEVPRFKYTELKKFTSFDEFLNWVPVTTKESIAGINSMLKKISIATKWHQDRWGLNTFTLREEVRQRQNKINDYLKNEVTIYELK